MNNGNESSADMSAASSKGAAKAKTPKASADTEVSEGYRKGDKNPGNAPLCSPDWDKIAICLISCRMVASYRSLKGCVRDINLIEGFLRGELNVPSEHIFEADLDRQPAGFIETHRIR